MATSTQTKSRANGKVEIQGLWWKSLTGVLMSYVCYGAFFIAQPAAGFTGGSGDTARIVFFHVPVAVLSYVAYCVGAWHAISVLRARSKPGLAGRNSDADRKSAAAMELGFVYCILATITGSIFSGAQWNSYWNWDPRQISIVIMLLVYAAYLLLRSALADRTDRRAELAAVYCLLALVPATFLIWIVPRLPWLMSLHPTEVLSQPKNTSLDYKMVLLPSFVAFFMLFGWMLQLRVRMMRLLSRG